MIINNENKIKILKEINDFDCKIISIDIIDEMIKIKTNNVSLNEMSFYTYYCNLKDKFFIGKNKEELRIKEDKIKNRVNNKKAERNIKNAFLLIFLISSSMIFVGISNPLILLGLSGLSVSSAVSYVFSNKIFKNLNSFFINESLSDVRKEFLNEFFKNRDMDNDVDNFDKNNNLSIENRIGKLKEFRSELTSFEFNNSKDKSYIKIKSDS